MMKRKLVGGLKVYSFTLCIILFFSKNLFSSEIYDYQTEKFLQKLYSQIISVNSFDKKIKLKIINDDFPNAYVTEDNTIYLSSGLISYSPDYVSLLAVIAHEIGHIDNFHVSKRKKEIKNLRSLNSIGNAAAVIGSMIMQQPDLINAIIVNQTAANNFYLNFTQEQEIEADFYAIEIINKLGLPTSSVKELLLLLEDKSKFNIADEELKKFSTHPLFKKRYEIIGYEKNFRS